MLKLGPLAVWAGLCTALQAVAATSPSIAPSVLTLPGLRAPEAASARLPPTIALPPAPAQTRTDRNLASSLPGPDLVSLEISSLREDMAAEVPHLLHLRTGRPAELQYRAEAMLRSTNTTIDTPQLVVVVDRDPSIETLALMVARPGNAPWSLIGAAHVSTGQAGRKDYYITPVGVFRHTDAILDFRALGTYNEHHVRGLGLAGMRVWDFGWQWALKGWHNDIAGGDIRLQMHATDPTLLEQRLGRPASEGCVRVSSALNKFLDSHGVLDADYERVAATDIRYQALLKPDRTPSLLAGRLLIVVDSNDPIDEAPTQDSRPANWPPPVDVPPPVAVQE